MRSVGCPFYTSPIISLDRFPAWMTAAAVPRPLFPLLLLLPPPKRDAALTSNCWSLRCTVATRLLRIQRWKNYSKKYFHSNCWTPSSPHDSWVLQERDFNLWCPWDANMSSHPSPSHQKWWNCICNIVSTSLLRRCRRHRAHVYCRRHRPLVANVVFVITIIVLFRVY